MDRRKQLILIGIGVVLIIVFMVLSRITDDNIQPVFRDTLIAQNTVVELSNAAISNSSNPGVRNLAARISSTTASDRNQLSEFYDSAFDEPVKTADQEAIEKLENTHEGYDTQYRKLVLQYLQQSQRGMEALQANFTNTEFDAIIKQARNNHEAHIQKLSQEQSSVYIPEQE